MRIAVGACTLMIASGPVGSAQAAYPFAIRLTVPPEVLRARFTHDTPGGVQGPLNPSSIVPIGTQAADAYRTAIARLFQADASEVLDLSILRVEGAFEMRPEGWYAVVDHQLSLGKAGGELGRWKVRGTAPIQGLGESAVPIAFRAAAEDAVRRFALEFQDPASVARLLAERKVSPGAVEGGLGAPGPTWQPPPSPPRSTFVKFLEVGAGRTAISATTYDLTKASGRNPPFLASEARRDNMVAPSLRAGAASDWGLAQLEFSTGGAGWLGSSGPASVISLGLDVAPLLRLGRFFEIAAGGGVRLLVVEATVPGLTPGRTNDTSSSQFAPSVFSALRVVLPLGGGHLRGGIEVRHSFGASTRFLIADDATHSTFIDFDYANTVSGFVGYELGLGSR